MPDRPINVLRVITWLPVGGIERRLVAVLPRLDRARFNVQIVCVRERGVLAGELEAAGIKVHVVPFRSRWDPGALRRLAGLMRAEKIDIVHAHMYRANVPATVAARLAGVRRVWTQVHNIGTWETRRQAWVDRQLCRWRTGVIAVSERVRQDVLRTMRLPPERVRVIYNGVEIARFAGARARRAELRARLAVGPDDVVVLFAARLVEQKRCADLLEVAGRLQAEAGGARLRVWVVGDGPLRGKLEARAARLPRPQGVQFFGRRDDVEDFMAAADIFVLPSTREGFSNALVEAMASGLAVVATDVGGNAEAVRNGREGLIVPPLETGRLLAALRGLVNDATLRGRLAAAASARANEFSLERMVENVQRLYAETMQLQ